MKLLTSSMLLAISLLSVGWSKDSDSTSVVNIYLQAENAAAVLDTAKLDSLISEHNARGLEKLPKIKNEKFRGNLIKNIFRIVVLLAIVIGIWMYKTKDTSSNQD